MESICIFDFRSLLLHPDPSAHFSLASMLHNMGRLTEAEQVFREGAELAPSRTDLACGLVSNPDLTISEMRGGVERGRMVHTRVSSSLSKGKLIS